MLADDLNAIAQSEFYAVKEEILCRQRRSGRHEARHRQNWERHSAFDPILRNVSERLTGDCHLHADDRRYDFVQNSASLAQRGTADATRERPAHRS